MVRYLIDENLPPIYQTQLLRRKSDLTVWRVGESGTPPKGTQDPKILEWFEQHDFNSELDEILDDLVLIAEVDTPDEFRPIISVAHPPIQGI